MFKNTGKQMGGVSVSWKADDDRLAEGNNKYFGERIVGKFIEMNRFEKGKKTFTTYLIKLYADFNDESKFGQEPDGEEVTVWGTTVIDGCFERGSDGTGIKPGDIVEIVYHGIKETANGQNEYQNFTVGAFTPSPSFKPAASAAAPAAKKSKVLSELGY